jgi:adenosylcobyric acid synthase
MSTDTRVFGTYLHGLFDDDRFRHQFLRAARAFHKLAAPDELYLWKRLREESLNRLAREVEKALDMKTIFGWVGLPYEDNGGTKENPDRSQIEGAMR